MCITGGIWQWGRSLAANIAYPTWAASPENGWAETVLPYPAPRPGGHRPGGAGGIRLRRQHAPTGWQVLRAWTAPALWWTAWLTATLWVTLCLGVIVRRRWSEEEKLAFPMTTVPLQLADPEDRLFRDRLWWVGFAVSGAIGVLGIIHQFLPAIPAITTAVEIESFISQQPSLGCHPGHRPLLGSVGDRALLPDAAGLRLLADRLQPVLEGGVHASAGWGAG